MWLLTQEIDRRSVAKTKLSFEQVEDRMLLAADLGLMATAQSVAVLQDASSEILLSSPQYRSSESLSLLPGDHAIGAAGGHQDNADIARGNNNFLSVWTDYRTTPDDYPPFATEGTGGDIYAQLLGPDGNPVDSSPIVVNQDFGDQVSPVVAWNGESWLVVWKTQTTTLPTYDKLMAARVSEDGTLLDTTPIEVHNNEAFYDDPNSLRVAGDPNGWVVVFQANGPDNGVSAIRVSADGSLPTSAPITVHATDFATDFEIAFAGDEYLITWTDTFALPSKGQRFTPDLQPIGARLNLPGAMELASDGTDFLVTYTTPGPGTLVNYRAVVVQHDGTVNPGTNIAPQLSSLGPTDLTWDGSHYWATWGGITAARIDSNGSVVDPGGFELGTVGQFSVPYELDAGIGGGLQLIWNTGSAGAAFPKDVMTTTVTATGVVETDVLVTTGTPSQLRSDFAAGPNMFAVAFESRVSESTAIKVQRLDSAGAALDAEPILIATGADVSDPGIAFDGTRYLVVWREGNLIMSQRLATAGSLVGNPVPIMDGITPDVAGIDGNFLVVGTHYRNNPQERVTFTRRLDGASGTLLDSEPQELGNTVIFSQHPQVVAFNQRWLVTWQTNVSHNNPAASTRAAFVDLDGTSPGPFSVGLGWRPSVAVSGDRAMFVAVTDTIASAENDLMGRVMLEDGSFPAPAFVISEAPDKQLAPKVTFDGSEFLVAWQDKRNSGIYFDERTDIYSTRVTSDGVVLDFDVNGDGGTPLVASEAVELDVALIHAGESTLLATSTYTLDEFNAYRIGIQNLSATLTGDFNSDLRVDADDIDLLCAEIRNGSHAGAFDLTGDGLVDVMDMDEMVLNILNTFYGDANLDGTVDAVDFIAWNQNKFGSGGWASGDFTCDGIVDAEDFLEWNDNKFRSNAAAPFVGIDHSRKDRESELAAARADVTDHVFNSEDFAESKI